MTYQEFKDAVVRYAGQRQIGEYELYFTERDSAKVEIYKEEIKSYKTESGMGICFRCIADGKAGYASTENLTAEEAESLVLRAWDNAVSIESEEECFIHEPGDSYAAVEQDGGAAPQGTRLVEAALGLQRELYQADARVIDGTQSFVAYGEEKYAICNSKGLDLEDRVSYSICYAMPLVSEGGEMYDGLKDKMGRLEDFDLKAIAGEAVSTIGAGGVSSGSYNVVFSNRVMATLLAAYAPVFSAEAAQQGMSLLNGREGEKIAADMVTITDDPRYEGGVVKRTFDGEGVAAYEKNVVEQGRLVTLLHNLKTAAAAGVKSTGNASKASYSSVVGVSPFLFYIQPVEGTLEDILAQAGEGIYVTEVSGLHAGTNSVTGDFSLSSKGFLVKEGRKGVPVKNFTVSGNFFTLLKDIQGVGADLDFLGSNFGSPSVLVPALAVAGE